MSLRLTLVSHAATDATRTAKFPLDEPLEAGAYAKAAALSQSMGSIDAAWTSPARRAIQTAEALGLAALVDPTIADIDLGFWAGKSLAEVEATDSVGLSRWMTDPAAAPHGGESVKQLSQRISAWLDQLSDSRGRMVAITHAAVVRAAAVVALEANPASFWRIDVQPLSFSTFHASSRRWTVRCLNAHVP